MAAAEAEYMEYYYYEAENLLRYYFYQQDTGYTADEVMWRVNMNLDKEPYEDAELITDVDTLALIVNKRFKLDDNFVPENLVSLTSGRLATQETKTAYETMVTAAALEGYSLGECSAYRSIIYQDSLYNRYLTIDSQEVVDTYSARPGHSEHNTGRAIDLIGSYGSLNDFANTKEYGWVLENAYRFGFIIRYTEDNIDITGYMSEPWHIYYVGTLHALMIHELGIDSFEEYVAKYVEHTPEGFQFPDTPALPDISATPSVPVTPTVPEVTPDPEPETPDEPEIPAEPESDLEGESEVEPEAESEPVDEPEAEPELETEENLDN